MDVKDKLVLITGASRGIGEATARALAKKGSKVILVARTQSDLEKLAASIRDEGGQAYAYAADLSKTENLVSVSASIKEELGVPDILINSAGLGRWLYVHETPHEEVEMMIRLPYLAAFQLIHEFLPGMLERGSGHIVNINSPVSLIPWGGAAGYASSRWALRGLSESLKVDLRGTGVGISQVVLGEVDSNYWEANPGARKRLPKIARMIPVSTTEQAAKYILTAIRREKKEFTRPMMLLVFRYFLWLTPGITKWLIRSSSYKGSKNNS